MCRKRQNRCGYSARTCGYGRPGPSPTGLVTLGALVLEKQHEHDQHKAQPRFIGPPPPPNYVPADTLDQPWRQSSTRARPDPNLGDRPPSYHSYLPCVLAADNEKGLSHNDHAKDLNAHSPDTVGQPHINELPYVAPRGGMQMHNQEEVPRIDMLSHTASLVSSDSDSNSDDELIYTPAISISGRGAQRQCENCGHHARASSSVNGLGGINMYDHLPWRDVRDGRYGRKAEKRQRKYAARAGNVNVNGAHDAMYALVEAKYARKALRWHRKKCVQMGCWCAGHQLS